MVRRRCRRRCCVRAGRGAHASARAHLGPARRPTGTLTRRPPVSPRSLQGLGRPAHLGRRPPRREEVRARSHPIVLYLTHRSERPAMQPRRAVAASVTVPTQARASIAALAVLASTSPLYMRIHILHGASGAMAPPRPALAPRPPCALPQPVGRPSPWLPLAAPAPRVRRRRRDPPRHPAHRSAPARARRSRA